MGASASGSLPWSATMIGVLKHQVSVPTVPGRPVLGYFVAVRIIDTEVISAIQLLQTKLEQRFSGLVSNMPAQILHSTLVPWIAPLGAYGSQDREGLFQSVQAEYSRVFESVVRRQAPFDLVFDAIEVHPAAIILHGHDDGTYQRIRRQFASQAVPLPGTGPLPQIVHASIGRFLGEIELDEVREFLGNEAICVRQRVTELELVRETKLFMPEETVKRFPLA